MKISAIKQQVKNPERVSIFLDGKYSFSLSLNELVAEKLKIGLEVSQTDEKKYKKLSEDGKLKARALEWVMSRPRSSREFKNYMFRKKADPELTSRLLDEFVERNYINELRFAEWLSDVRRRHSKSDRAIRSELQSKGIDREIIDEIMSGADETERLKDLVNKKASLPRYKADPQKLMQYLARQGFSYNDIKAVLNEITTQQVK
jgi:regulatory protein